MARLTVLMLGILLLLVNCRKEVAPFPRVAKVVLAQDPPWWEDTRIGIFSDESFTSLIPGPMNEDNALVVKTMKNNKVYFELIPGNYYAVILPYYQYYQAFQINQQSENATVLVTLMD